MLATAPVTDVSLRRALADGYLGTIVPGLVAPSPDEAVQRIAKRFGERPTRSGRGNSAIGAFREWLFDHTQNGRAKDALLMVAPHTHWDDGLPIVYRKDSPDRYVVGPTRLDDSAVYRPVSFVFAEGGARPYEWADASIALPDAELAELYAVIGAASDRFWREAWPFGVSINFRFKSRLFEDRYIDNVEREIDGDAEDQSEIIAGLRGPATAAEDGVLQVAWHCYSDRCYGLSEAEAALVDRLRELSDTMSADEWSSATASTGN